MSVSLKRELIYVFPWIWFGKRYQVSWKILGAIIFSTIVTLVVYCNHFEYFFKYVPKSNLPIVIIVGFLIEGFLNTIILKLFGCKPETEE